MCIVIDVNALWPVLDPGNSMHQEFRPVRAWILACKGKMVYGGTTYNKEIRKSDRFRKFILELMKARKVVQVSDNAVDKIEKELLKKVVHRDFNDAHITAIVIVSRCKLVCSADKRSYRFLKRKELYPKNLERPKIYSGAANIDLLRN